MTNKIFKGQNRRNFIQNSLKAGAVLPFLNSPLLSHSATLNPKPRPATHPLKILILGGTSFLGPHQIAYALERGHSITTFTRGKTAPTVHKKLFKQVESLVGDREDNLEALKGRKWDAVIDNSGRRVHWTKATAELLKDNVGMYMYTSTVSVYYPYLKPDMKEDRELVLKMPETFDGEGEKMAYEYGTMKANSELEAIKAFGKDRSTIIRPTLMVGPADRTDRFMYWPVKLPEGGDIIVPGKAKDSVQYIDVRDMAEFMIRLLETGTAGTFNGVGPASKTPVSGFAYGAHAAFGSKVNFVNIDDYDFLLEHGLRFIGPWILPQGKSLGMMTANNDHSIKNGLTFRPLASTVTDTHEWWYSNAVTEERRTKFRGDGSLIKRQGEIIKAWRNR